MSLGEFVTLAENCMSVRQWLCGLDFRLVSHLEMKEQLRPISYSFSEKMAFHRSVFSYGKCSIS